MCVENAILQDIGKLFLLIIRIQQCPLPRHNPPPETYICKICMVKGHWIYQCPARVPKHQLFPY
jgi:hypothetical protein